MLNAGLQCLELAHVGGDSHHSNIGLVTKHGNGDDRDAISFGFLDGCNKCIAVVIETGLAEIMNNCKAN